jgi:tartrate dehydrogenase/decarboxylase/D-malate dehydrogenase
LTSGTSHNASASVHFVCGTSSSAVSPIHISAFDITSKGVANPVATFWTASMMLEHLGEPKAAARLMRAIERTTEEQVFTPDLGGVHDTRAVTNAVKRALEG